MSAPLPPVPCRQCGETRRCTKTSRARRLCAECDAANSRAKRNKSEAGRLLAALRKRASPEEGGRWRREQVEMLIAATDRSEYPEWTRWRVVKEDEALPFTPGNAKLVPFKID